MFKNRRRRWLWLLLIVPLGLGATACTSAAKRKLVKAQQNIVQQDVTYIDKQISELRKAEKLPYLHDSAALRVQDAFYTADADPNKLWYVTMVAMDGTPYAHYVTRGAPQPAGDEVTNPVQLYCQHIGGGTNIPDGCGDIGLAEPNGVHQGTSNSGYVAISITGAILRFPSEGAHISDQPFKIDTPVKLQLDESAEISKTDTSKTDNPEVPTGTGTRSTTQ
jgi:hypothetical protein